MVELHETLRCWISEILKNHHGVLPIALRQRAKFEGWLKFELAAKAEKNGATNLAVEAPLLNGGRSDISFDWQGMHYDIELKTPNTSLRIPGIPNLTRPITKNLSSIVSDAHKAPAPNSNIIIAFVIFPVPRSSSKWEKYLDRIGGDLGLSLDRAKHTTQLTIQISAQDSADVVVCCFPV